MAPVKQVLSLRDISLLNVQNYIKCSAHELMAVVSEISKRDKVLGHSFLRTSISHLSHHVFDSISCDLVDNVVPSILQLLPKLIDDLRGHYMVCFSTESFLVQMKCMVYFATLVFHPKVKSIDISCLPRVMKHTILSELHKLSGLRTLDLGAGSSGWEISEIERFILKGVCTMSQLRQIHLSIDCTDAIIKCLSENCKLLEVLNVPNSRSVTERCIPYLTQMTKLRQVLVTHTSITEQGYIQILSKLPDLINMGRCEYIMGVMRVVKVEEKILNLTNLECSKIDPDTLSTIVDLCPNLIHLTLDDVHELDISRLLDLKLLKSLALSNGNISLMKLLPYLQAHGMLERLYLKGIHSIDEILLMNLSDACPELNVLVLDTCQYGSSSTRYSIKRSKYFQNLESLAVYSTCPAELLDILLSSCHGIKSIVMGSSILPNDVFLLQILRNNPLQKLHEMRISHCHTLSIVSVNALIKQCTKLRFLMDLRTWYLISETDFVQLKQEILGTNLDLTITHYLPPDSPMRNV